MRIPIKGRNLSGFTLVELVVVIILLGILAAVALPQFIDVDDRSRVAAAEGTAGAFETAVSTLHAQWLVEGQPSAMVVDGVTIEFSANGWPISTVAGTAGCIDLWERVLSGAAPIVAYVAGGTPPQWSALGSGSSFCIFVHQYGQAYSGTNLQPFILYQLIGNNFTVRKFNMS